MINLAMPEGTVREMLRSCTTTMENVDLVTRVIAAEAHFDHAERVYKSAATKFELYNLPTSTDVAGIVTLEEMKWIYKNKLAKLNSPSRWLYDRLKIKTKICPLCNCRTVGTLDHYLAQSSYAAYTITPVNLVPACTDCNKIKSSVNATTLEKQTLHPYFDVLPVDQPWLFVSVTEEEPPGVIYVPLPPTHWDENISARIVEHFRIFELDVIYAAKASSELAELKQTFLTTRSLYGTDGFKDYLAQQARDRRSSSPHSWKAALYDGLARSEWFVSIGYSVI